MAQPPNPSQPALFTCLPSACGRMPTSHPCSYGKYHPIEELGYHPHGRHYRPASLDEMDVPAKRQEQHVDIDGQELSALRKWATRITSARGATHHIPCLRPNCLRSHAPSLNTTRKPSKSCGSYLLENSSTLTPLTEMETETSTGRSKIPLKVRFHYMVGNHDWYYHLKGKAFDQIRQEIIDAMGLSNPPISLPLRPPQIKHRLSLGDRRIP